MQFSWLCAFVWEGHSEVVSEGQQLSSLVFEVVDELGIFSILPRQHFLFKQGDNSLPLLVRKMTLSL